MSDLVKRLRALLHGDSDRSEILVPEIYNPMRDAADRIEALEREVRERNDACKNTDFLFDVFREATDKKIAALEAALREVRGELAKDWPTGGKERPHHIRRACIVTIDRALEGSND
jgi:hypothetical protein